jgi:dTDP-4-amino-4,6-dideoxygalactose transaminase
MSIQFYNLTDQWNDQKYEILNALIEVGESGQYFANAVVERFENMLSNLYDGASCSGCSSGTAALTVSLKAANLPANSQVAIPAMTYVATANAVHAAGLQPICIDIDSYWLMDYDCLVENLERNKNISAVIAVDLYGQGVDLRKFKKACDHFNVKLIVDAAQSFNIFYNYYKQIDHCDSLALSFNPLKNLGALGNAGAIVSKVHTATELKKWCIQGKEINDVINPGFNCRIDAVQAAVLEIKYKIFEDNQQRKNDISWHYREELASLFEMPDQAYYCSRTDYVFPIAVNQIETTRLMLTLNDIEFGCHYEKPLHHYTAYRRDIDYCPNASKLAGRIISLPNHWHLTDDDVSKVIQTVKSSL